MLWGVFMSYAIIRNTNYKMKNLPGIYRHIERKNTNYSNKDINRDNSKENYSIKCPNTTYEKLFRLIKDKYDLKGQIKSVSNIACEYIITSDKEFFDSIGKEETKRFFKSAYSFVCNYKNLGKQYILSAKIHMDEKTPHMHLVFIPVIHTRDKLGNDIDKIACSEFWKGKNSYNYLQDNFYSYITACGFQLDRGQCTDNKHITVSQLKSITNYDKIIEKINSNSNLKDLETSSLELAISQNKKLVNYCNHLESYYIASSNVLHSMNNLKEENIKLKNENKYLKSRVDRLKEQINNIINSVIKYFNISKITLLKLLKRQKYKNQCRLH